MRHIPVWAFMLGKEMENKKMIRKPFVVGQFYDAGRSQLIEQIKSSFLHEKGPGSLPSEERQGRIKGVISPHAGYMFSGPCAAHCFKAIAESDFADLYIILGPSHMGFNKSCFSDDDWETPLGIAGTDPDFGKILQEHNIGCIPLPHLEEHSIEVQIPFLQFACSGKEKNIKFIPLMVSDSDYEETAKNLINSIKEYEGSGRKAAVIASSDFTHLGANYGFMPFSKDIRENMHRLDKGAIDTILKLDAEGFMEYCKKTKATICGKYALYVFIEVMKSWNASAELLQYYTSADMIGDYSNAVGYAGIIFK